MKWLLVLSILGASLLSLGCQNQPQAVTSQPAVVAQSDATVEPTLLSPEVTSSRSANVTREEAIQIASERMQPSVLERAHITAELRGWYWEVVFDGLNATPAELMPFPLGEFHPPPPISGQQPADPFAGETFQSVVISIDPNTGAIDGIRLYPVAEAGTPMSEAQAIKTARDHITTFQQGLMTGEDFSWVNKANVQARLIDNTWTVVFWEDENPDHRLRVSFNATTGEDMAVSRG